MTQDETIKILAILKAAYPNSYKGMTKDEAMGTIAIWTMQFDDIPADIVLMAINKLISTNQFPPSISEVKSKFSTLHWEAYEKIADVDNGLSKEDEAKYQRIYDITNKYKHKSGVEPKLTEMLNGGTQKYLNG